MLEIRAEQAEDRQAIHSVEEAAFGRSNEARLVDALRRAGKATVSWVALEDGEVTGHVLFSPVEIDPPQPHLKGLGLGPVAVRPDRQGQGTGAGLIRASLDLCRTLGFDFAVVLGNPRYYSRFGFRRAAAFGLGNEFGADEAFMALELRPGALAGTQGVVKYAAEFAEFDEARE